MPRMMALPANRALWRAVAAVVATRQERPTTTAATLKEIKTALVQAASLNKSGNVRSDIPLGGNSSSWRGVSAMGTTTSVGSIRYTNTGAQTSASSVQSNGNPRRSPPAVAHGGAAVPTPASERSKLALPGEPLIHGHQHGDHHNDHHSQGGGGPEVHELTSVVIDQIRSHHVPRAAQQQRRDKEPGGNDEHKQDGRIHSRQRQWQDNQADQSRSRGSQARGRLFHPVVDRGHGGEDGKYRVGEPE